MSDSGAIQDRVLTIVAETLRVEPKTLSPATRLFAGGLELDSLSAVRIVSALEEQLGVTLDEDDLDLAALQSIGSLARLAASRRDEDS